MKILFVIRKSRINAKGECPIYCRITISGIQSTPFSTGLFVPPSKWNAAAQKATSRIINEELARLRTILTDIFLQERATKKWVSPDQVIDLYRNGIPDPVSWQEAIKEHLDSLASRGRAQVTLKMYRRHITRFSEWIGCPPAMVSKPDISRYYEKLLSTPYCRDYCNKTIQAIYGLFQHLVKQGRIKANPAQGFGLDWENKEDTTHLTEEELFSILKTEWSPAIQKTVDAFLFMCYSGMHVSDYLSLDSNNIQDNCLVYRRGKTGVIAEVPLNPVLAGLILKYGSIESLPRCAAQKMNLYLKIVAERCQINKKLTNKVARKTFTDMCLNVRDIPQEVVASMLGHSSVNYIRKYGRIRRKRILSEWKDTDLISRIAAELREK